ncbi:DUF4910 domain-containing protein [Nitrosarchaeum sp.]|uniref:DUF4910 domain-containing protein n=1 Tax=Nitrosarchaeum sp. TaxID=2026886 RepID=UPI00247EE3A6|nr:DUF4910 domain-containing protein [Nitrosarchaeum sp.]MCV0411914.1 DUF4910 domain-containing protein [Nitrosarchaeum sp.]
MDSDSISNFDSHSIGKKMTELMKILFPIPRSITGNGVRDTLKIIQKYINLEISEIPSGTKVFDWIVPEEWNIKDAYIMNSNNEKIIDFKKSNLHILQYSIPKKTKISFEELKKHIFTLPNQPNAIPYVTSFYSKNWGFCMTHNEFLKLKNDEYFVLIDSSHTNGSLTYGEYLIKGKSENEILISTYVCHPSLCNDNLSGLVLCSILAEYLSHFDLYYSIRFLFIPETIGAITWLSLNENIVNNISHGLVATCLGDSGISTYKKSRNGNNTIDEVVELVLKESGEPYKILDFWPSGSDERQFCSPGFNLPMGSLMRTPYDMFEQYHTSLDNLAFMNEACLVNSFFKYVKIIEKLNKNYQDTHIRSNTFLKNKKSIDGDPVFLNLFPKCEPQLGKRGLYNNQGGIKGQEILIQKKAIAWLLNFSDGKHSLKDIEKKSGLDYNILYDASNILIENKLIIKL